MAEEVVVYRDDNIHITNLRAVLQGKTYAMANVTSVSMHTQYASKAPGIIVAALGALICLGGLGSRELIGCLATFGIILLIVGLAYAHAAKNTYWVRIGSASGETNALSSHDYGYIGRIVEAMNEAIIRRG